MIDKDFAEKYLKLKDGDQDLLKLFPWQKEIVEAAMKAAKKGNKLMVYRSRPQGMSMVVLEFQRLAIQQGLIKHEEFDELALNKWHQHLNAPAGSLNMIGHFVNEDPPYLNSLYDLPGVIRHKDQEHITEQERWKLRCLQERERWADGEYFTFHADGNVDKDPFDPETWKKVAEENKDC